LAAAISDGELWTVPHTRVPFIDEIPGFIAAVEANFAEGIGLAFAIIDNVSGKVCGSTRFMEISQEHKRSEIGYSFVVKSLQRSYVNTEAKLLLLSHGFEVLQLNRMFFVTDNDNKKSRQALERIGATYEGLLRMHMVMREGRLRDSVIYSIIAPEWPTLKRQLQARLQS
jgi:RimJ/RimL family protein N-acetyltransferase